MAKQYRLKKHERDCVKAWRAVGISIERAGDGWRWHSHRRGFVLSPVKPLVDLVEELAKLYDPRFDYADHDYS